MLQTESEDFDITRREALRGYDVLESEPEESFDRLTRLAQAALQTPIALISLVDRDRQWVKSHMGIEYEPGSAGTPFCAEAIRGDGPLIVPDARSDQRFSDTALVRDAGIRSYVGVPLRLPEGYNIGTLCAMDRSPRAVTPGELSMLQDLAGLAVDELELRKLATTDSLTGALTRRGLAAETARETARARRYCREIGCVVFDVDGFKAINDAHGHAAGDIVLQRLVRICRRELRATDVVGRLGGEEFAVVLPETPLAGALITAERIRHAFAEAPVRLVSDKTQVTASFGVTEWSADDNDFTEVLQRADAAVYEAKRQGRNRCVCSAP
jgi:diguanylate cyclase (GGDEF)-like protein